MSDPLSGNQKRSNVSMYKLGVALLLSQKNTSPSQSLIHSCICSYLLTVEGIWLGMQQETGNTLFLPSCKTY